MGIINITSDSFFGGSRVKGVEDAVQRAADMLQAGADILDLGAASTRPGAAEVPMADEAAALIPVVKEVAARYPGAVISVDTYRAEVAAKAVEAGAHMVNDVGGGMLDPNMYAAVAEMQVPYILMHNRGTPLEMQNLTDYRDVLNDVVKELSQKAYGLRSQGVCDIIIDPGLGFAKTVVQNFEILNRLEELQVFGCPLLIGLSRKSMVWRTLQTDPEGALNGTTALHMAALLKGASILRVHDVKEAVETIAMYEALKQGVSEWA